jgi:hypothetical protein
MQAEGHYRTARLRAIYPGPPSRRPPKQTLPHVWKKHASTLAKQLVQAAVSLLVHPC